MFVSIFKYKFVITDIELLKKLRFMVETRILRCNIFLDIATDGAIAPSPHTTAKL